MNKVVAFDLDGTLANSALHLLPSYHDSLARMNREDLPDNVLLQCIGGTQTDNHALVMPDCSWETFLQYESLVAGYASEYAKTRGKCYAHIEEALDLLRARGYLTVLCSNGTREYVCPLLDVLGLTEHLHAVQAITNERNKTELLASIIRTYDCAGNVAMVGDRHFDAEAARNNHAPFIGCKYGLFPDEIEASHPDAILEDPLELPSAVERLLGPVEPVSTVSIFQETMQRKH